MHRTSFATLGFMFAFLVPALVAFGVDVDPGGTMGDRPGRVEPAEIDLGIKQQNGIDYINGGVADEKTMLEHMRGRFNLKLTIATPGGKFNAAPLRIEDSHGKLVLDLPEAGPMLLAQLPPGSYTVRVTPTDAPRQVRTVSIPSSGREEVAIIIPDHSSEPSRVGDAPE